MARLLTFLSFRTVIATDDWLTVFVPLSPREIPRNQLADVIRAWFQPEFCWINAYLDLQQAIQSQQCTVNYDRFPYTDAVRVIVELQVPSWLVEVADHQIKVDLREGMEWIQISNIYITAKYVAGYMDEEVLPGDLPFDGTVHETIAFLPLE